MINNIHENIILPKLQTEVELWDPLTDRVPLHAWLHPWLPRLGTHLEIVYPTIRNKLSSALHSWHPSDRSAKLILMPWVEVFSKVKVLSWEILIRKKHRVARLDFPSRQPQATQDIEWLFNPFLPCTSTPNFFPNMFAIQFFAD